MEKSIRPWGDYDVLLDSEICKVKRISVRPGQSLSYQYHHKRSEDWIIVQGAGEVRIDSKKIKVSPGDRIHIPPLVKHSVRSFKNEEDLVFIEVQTGDYFGEDDIVRIEDDYGRVDS